MSQVAARPVAASADSAVARVRHPAAKGRSDGKADADFGKHIDGMAAGDEPGANTAPAMVGDRPRPTARWLPLKDREPLVLLPDEAPVSDLEVTEAANSAVAELPTDATAALFSPAPVPPASDMAAAAASIAASSAEPRPVNTDKAPRASTARSLITAALPAMPTDSPLAPIAPDDLPRSQLPTKARGTPHTPKEMPSRVHEVVVIARETHLPPAAPSPTLRARLQGARDTAQPRASSVAEPEVTTGKGVVADIGANQKSPVRPATRATAGERDASQRPATSAMPGRLPLGDGGPRVQVEPAGESPFGLEVPQAVQAAGPVVQEDQPLPQLTLPVSRQVADGIAAAFPPLRGASAVRPAFSPDVSPAAQPVKVVTIELSPAELGTLTVRIALKNDALELQVETSRRETARLVDADRDTLSNLLRSAGYHVEAMTVRAVEPSGAATASGPSPGSQEGAPQSQSGGSQAEQGPSGGRPHAGQDREGHGTRQDIRGEEGGTRAGGGSGLYV